MTPDVTIRRQKRRTLMMRVVPGGLEVFIPHHLHENHPEVRAFIAKARARLADQVPPVPDERTSAADVLALVDHWAARIGVQPARVQMRDMTRKWGSCSSRGTVTLNTRLCWLDRHLVEYVVCHELVHLRHLNHSRQFWDALAQYLPDYRQREAELHRQRFYS